MVTPRRRKCLCCKKIFHPDPRQKKRQRYCAHPTCRKASKAASQKKWLGKPENKDYFSSSENVQRVQAWRVWHPGYWRINKQPLTGTPLQDPSLVQVTDNPNKSSKLARHALHDLKTLQVPVLVGIIAHLTGETLQDQIAMTVDRLLTLGADILNNSTPQETSSQGVLHESQPHQPGTPALSPPAI